LRFLLSLRIQRGLAFPRSLFRLQCSLTTSLRLGSFLRLTFLSFPDCGLLGARPLRFPLALGFLCSLFRLMTGARFLKGFSYLGPGLADPLACRLQIRIGHGGGLSGTDAEWQQADQGDNCKA
jgi:hypothetical protein